MILLREGKAAKEVIALSLSLQIKTNLLIVGNIYDVELQFRKIVQTLQIAIVEDEHAKIFAFLKALFSIISELADFDLAEIDLFGFC